jgi:hypothetical protein
MQKKQQSNSGLIVAGYIISIMPLLIFPIVFIPAGVFIGILNISKNETAHGFFQIIISIVAGLYGIHLGGAGFGL